MPNERAIRIANAAAATGQFQIVNQRVVLSPDANRNLLDAAGMQLPPDGLRISLDDPITRAMARTQIAKHWNAMGGPKSVVGLPIGANLEVAYSSGQFVARFRSGTLGLSHDWSSAAVYETRVVNIWLMGIECQVRQEKADELYGVVFAIGPSDHTIRSVRFPASEYITMGPSGQRITKMALPLVEDGLIQNYAIAAALVENDSGDIDAIAASVADKVATAAGSLLAGC